MSDALTPDDLAELARLGAALRGLLDVTASVAVPAAVSQPAARSLQEITRQLAEADLPLDGVPDYARYVLTLPGHALTPPLTLVRRDDEGADLRVTFGRYYRNAFGSANGGAIAMMFDTAIAQSASGGTRPSRTARLEIDYRSPVPIGAELDVRVRLTEVDGRKRRLAADLLLDDQVLAQATGLMIEARDDATSPQKSTM